MATNYLIENIGLSNGRPYAFHLEGNITNNPNFFEGTDDKPSKLVTSIGIKSGCFELLAKAKGEAVPADRGVNFVTLVVNGKLAEKLRDEAAKGVKIAVTGEIALYTGKDSKQSVEVRVDNFVLLPRDGGTRNKRISAAPCTFKGKNGTVTKNLVTLLTANIIRVDGVKTARSGTEYLRVSGGLVVPAKKVYDLATSGKVGKYDEDATEFITLVYFGDSAKRMANLLKKGMTVALTGEISEDAYEGKTSYTMVPRNVSIVKWDTPYTATAPSAPPVAPSAPAPTAAAPQSTSAFDQSEDYDDLPF